MHRWFERCAKQAPGVWHLTMDGLGLAPNRAR
jgi:hypothetical protein